MNRKTTFIKKVIVSLMLVFTYLASGQLPVSIKNVDKLVHTHLPRLLKQLVSRITDNAQTSAAKCEQVKQVTSCYLIELCHVGLGEKITAEQDFNAALKAVPDFQSAKVALQ
ncbi:hypothetical protein [Mucilaginibacter sp. L196]|uniref:hypothetical protein n=1 Tax=Mucilaginibacter sp. L196 TaxID=1641870 RepID=UPI00131C57B1|nr:hypothetical protein [Mucilaginibacter sp. L196]